MAGPDLAFLFKMNGKTVVVVIQVKSGEHDTVADALPTVNPARFENFSKKCDYWIRVLQLPFNEENFATRASSSGWSSVLRTTLNTASPAVFVACPKWTVELLGTSTKRTRPPAEDFWNDEFESSVEYLNKKQKEN